MGTWGEGGSQAVSSRKGKDFGKYKCKVSFFCFFFSFRTTSEMDPLFICVTVHGSGKGHNQANNKITLDQITSALVVNDTKKFGAPRSQERPFYRMFVVQPKLN